MLLKGQRRAVFHNRHTRRQVWKPACNRPAARPPSACSGHADDGTGAGVAWYDLDVSVDGGAWQSLLTNTQSTNTQYPGEYCHRYTFRASALSPERSGRGVALARKVYYPFGKERWASAELPTDFGYTGQRLDGTGLMFYNARYYAPQIGRFISADTIIPDPGNPQDFNRYSYVRNNPLRFVDPSGHDPLDSAWEEEWRRNNCPPGDDTCGPTDKDRHDRLFSLIFPGSGPGGSWTGDDWKRYAAADVYDNDGDYLGNGFWTELHWDSADLPSVHRFARHVERLVAWYTEGEEDLFVRAFGWVFGGIPYGNWVHLAAMSVANGPKEWQPLEEGEAGWMSLLVEPGDNPSHHYAGLFFAGYYYSGLGRLINFARDYNNQPDFWLGEFGVWHGALLREGYITLHHLSALILSLRGGVQQ